MQTHTCAYTCTHVCTYMHATHMCTCQICVCMETCVWVCMCLHAWIYVHDPPRGLHECVHSYACTCVQGYVCRRAGLCVRVCVNTGTLRGPGGRVCRRRAPLWVGTLLFLPGLAGAAGTVWLRLPCSKQIWVTLPAPHPAQAWHPPELPYLGINHGREEGPKILCRLEARDTDREEVAAGRDQGSAPPRTPRPPAANPISPPLGHSRCPL